MKALLFFLLPEYQDPGNPVHAFLATEELQDDQSLNVYLRKLKSAVSYLKNEDVMMYYDVKNLAAFLYPVRLMPDVYPQKSLYQLVLIERLMQSWRNHSDQEPSDHFEYLNQKTEDNTLCEIAKRQYKDKLRDCVYAVVNHDAIKQVTNDRERIYLECNGKLKSFVAIKADVKMLMAWLTEKGVINRVYLPNTDKHGTGGKGGSQDSNVSPLLCQNREAKKMMKKAFRCGKHLYYYDAVYRKYIRFMNGGNNTFHPYHIISKQDEEKYVKQDVKVTLKLHLGNIHIEY